ncbi:D-hexose-6-phosphate mutarotase [Aquabacterium sp. J223]|uniref:D-hexose-6-phosphate mutarotase n=1 Tax=Aquabacterium sp. J223 TaxID=2898431 RepID=UPI0021ADDA1A|nr:D-hexose-6-phosphate mutarotase [Aquabacterium sp. J223]UUX95710.1 D-hexose-6-phosphate mutarotase [Aquabacterium sp. J223]
MTASKVQRLGRPGFELRSADGASATFLLDGGQVLSWRTPDGRERLYVSPLAQAGEGRAVRGGVPVVFPQFGKRGPLAPHGFARNRPWKLVDAGRHEGHAVAVLRLESDDRTRALWDHDFEAELTVGVVGGRLDLELAIENTDAAPFEFACALHTYLACEDVRALALQGLDGAPYEDHRTGERAVQAEHLLRADGELDRLYADARRPLVLRGEAPLAIAQDGFHDVVVWNPGAERARAIADLPDGDWTRFLCIEAAQARVPVGLPPGEVWVGRQTLQLL